MRRMISTYAIASAIAALILASGGQAQVAKRPSTQPRKETDAATDWLRETRRHNEFLDRIKNGPIDVVMLGDSIFDLWPRCGELSWLKFAPYRPANFGISSEKTDHLLGRLANGALDGFSAKVVVVLIGTNNIGNPPVDKPEWAAAGVAKVVEVVRAKQPQAKVLLLAVFPREDKNAPRRAAVAGINEIIRTLDDGKGVRYLDLGHLWLDADGEIALDVMPDKLHPNAKGYDRWFAAMQPVLDEMVK